MSLFVLYFGTRRRYPDLAHHTVLFGPRYRDLLREIFHGPDAAGRLQPVPAPADGDRPIAGAAGLRDVLRARAGAAPRRRRHRLGPAGGAVRRPHPRGLEAAGWPDLRREIVTKRLFTPLDFRDRLAAYHGSAFSLAPRLGQSAYFRPHNRDPRIPGLYIVGAGTHPGAGVPGVINSAKATSRLVLRDLGVGAEAIAS